MIKSTIRRFSVTLGIGRKHNFQSETLTDIVTGKNYTSDHDIFREQARKFWKNIHPERVKLWNDQKMTDREIWKEAGSAGLLCIDTPARYGGIGACFSYVCVALEEQGYAGPDFFGPGLDLHSRYKC